MTSTARALAGVCSLVLALFIAAGFWIPARHAIGSSLPLALLIHLAGLVVFGMTFALLYGWALHRIEHG